MDIADLTNQMLLLDCGMPVSDERLSSNMHGVKLSARIAVAGWCLPFGCLKLGRKMVMIQGRRWWLEWVVW